MDPCLRCGFLVTRGEHCAVCGTDQAGAATVGPSGRSPNHPYLPPAMRATRQRRKKLPFVLAAVVTVLIIGSSQVHRNPSHRAKTTALLQVTAPTTADPSPSTTVASGWVPFNDPQGHFEVDLPSVPTFATPTIDLGGAPHESPLWTASNTEVGVLVSTTAIASSAGSTPGDRAALVKNRINEAVHGVSGTIAASEATTADGAAVGDATIVYAGGYLKLHVVVNARSMFAVATLGTDSAVVVLAHQHVLTSFRIR